MKSLTRWEHLCVALCFIIFSTGCSQPSSSNSTDVHPERQALSSTTESFGVVILEKSGEGERAIRLAKSALHKAFLLSPTIVVRSNNPIIDHLAPKIVSFERQGSQLALFELNKDAVYNNLNSDRLLETFPVESEDEQFLVFSWNYSLSSIPMTSFLAGGASDFPAETPQSQLSSVLPTKKSFLQNAQIRQNELEITQISEVLVHSIPLNLNTLLNSVLVGKPIQEGQQAMTVTMYVNLKPYVANPHFKMRPSAFHEGVGAFETAVMRHGEGKIDYYASLWDMSPERGPLKYAITKGTPVEYVEAIREGILYWNRVAGREIIQVSTNADPEAVPTERVVLVHWIPWDQAGFARASFHTDPLTGEILRADVYLTSAFARGANVAIRTAFENALAELMPSPVIVPGFFHSATLCNHETATFAELQFLDVADRNSAVIQQFILDQIRAVTAHEVGHTLGMRHNFAGSLYSKVPSAVEQNQAEVKYLKGELKDGAEVTSSVMDYIFGMPNGLMGAFIRTQVLAYDQAFLKWGYEGKSVSELEVLPPFCTDGRVSKISGCATGDVGANTISSTLKKITDRKRTLENKVLHEIVRSFHPQNPLDRVTPTRMAQILSQVGVKEAVAARIADLDSVHKLMTKKAEDFGIEKQVGQRSWHNEKKYDAAMAKKVNSEFSSVGGVMGFVGALYPLNADFVPQKGWLKTRLMSIYNRPDFKQGTTIEGVSYVLSASEEQFILALIEGFADQAEEIWLLKVIEGFTFDPPEDSSGVIGAFSGTLNKLIGLGEKEISPLINQEEWWPSLAKFAENIIVLRQGEAVAKVNDTVVMLPKPIYSVDVREAAVKMALPENYNLPYSQKANLEAAKAQLLKELSVKVGKDLKSFEEVKIALKTLKLDRAASQWFQEELTILKKVSDKL